MSDFFQTGVVATLHRLVASGHDRLEQELSVFARNRPIALVLPALWREFEGPALPRILAELNEVPYLSQIVFTISGADAAEFEKARAMTAHLPQEVTFIWNDGPRLQGMYERLERNNLPVGVDGKGRSCWLAFGYVLVRQKAEVIALHDCDVLTFNREFLARLCYPVVNPNLSFEFCKGYYARVTDRMHGRVTRLLVTPLVRSLQLMLGPVPFLAFLDSFRYPLAGEFCMKADLARVNRIPSDWGLEVGVLGEVFRNCSVKRVCQSELCDTYEHRHQALSPDDPAKGLMKMAVDICKTLFRTLAAEGTRLDSGVFRALQSTYVRTAEDTITRYQADALIDGLLFDRHQEEVTVACFAKAIRMASESYLADPLGQPLLPNWNRITAALPGFLEEIQAQVDLDNGRETSCFPA